MKQLSQGFTLLELLIALSISSMLTFSLYKLIQQTRSIVTDITTVIATDVPLDALYAQLEKDITGIFTPFSVQKELNEIAQQPEKPEGYAPEQKLPEKPSDKKPEEKKPEDKKPENKKIEQVFYVEQNNTGLFWSFLTTGGLQAITSKGELQARQFIKRVAYRLEPDTDNPGNYSLYYSYTIDNLDLDTLKNRPIKQYYELIGDIRQFKIGTTVFEVPEASEPQTGQGIPKPDKLEEKPKTAQKLERWNEKEIKEKYRTVIPAFVSITGTLVTAHTAREFPFEFVFKVPAYQIPAAKKPKKPAMPLPNKQ